MIGRFVYPAILTPDEGRFVVEFPDVPEALTVGNDAADAYAQAADCLDEAIAGRIKRRDEIPTPSARHSGQVNIAVPPLMAAKAALYLSMRDAKISNVALARKLGVDERQVRWMLDPKRATRLPQIEWALAALGKGLEIRLVDQPGMDPAKRQSEAASRRAGRQTTKKTKGREERQPKPQPVRRRA